MDGVKLVVRLGLTETTQSQSSIQRSNFFIALFISVIGFK